MVKELRAAERRSTSLAALVPFLGPILVQRSEEHTDAERAKLMWLSLAVSVAAAVAIFWLLARWSEPTESIADHVKSQIRVLGGIAEEYRAKNGAYPDPAAWQALADLPDPRFYDPWGHLYRYEPTGGAVTISSLGRDDGKGGTDEDADVSLTFPEPAASR